LSITTRAWLFVRGSESVRIVIEGTSVGVYGPGTLVRHCTFAAAMEATLHQADIERGLVMEGWTLEQLTTERRSAQAETSGAAPPGRRRTLRLVPAAEDPDS
jgi:hypothetical protein